MLSFSKKKEKIATYLLGQKNPKKPECLQSSDPILFSRESTKNYGRLVFICSLNNKKTNDKIKLKKKILTFYLPTKNEKQTLVTEINKYKIYTKSMNNNFIVQKHAKSSWKVIILPRCHHETTHLC